jgi:putative transposase
MKKSRFSEVQIAAILKEGANGTSVPDLCRKHGMSSAAFYKWRSQYGGLEASQLALVKSLQIENNRLKKMYADAQLDALILKEALAKK